MWHSNTIQNTYLLVYTGRHIKLNVHTMLFQLNLGHGEKVLFFSNDFKWSRHSDTRTCYSRTFLNIRQNDKCSLDSRYIEKSDKMWKPFRSHETYCITKWRRKGVNTIFAYKINTQKWFCYTQNVSSGTNSIQ